MILLSLDLGKKRVGVAVSHGILAEALVTIKLEEDRFDDFIFYLKGIIIEQKVQMLIIGLPLGKDLRETEQTRWTRMMALKIKEATSLPQFFVEEAYSTTEASTVSKEKENLDSLSAKIILEQYLNERR